MHNTGPACRTPSLHAEHRAPSMHAEHRAYMQNTQHSCRTRSMHPARAQRVRARTPDRCRCTSLVFRISLHEHLLQDVVARASSSGCCRSARACRTPAMHAEHRSCMQTTEYACRTPGMHAGHRACLQNTEPAARAPGLHAERTPSLHAKHTKPACRTLSLHA